MKHALLIFLFFSTHTLFAEDGQTLHDSYCTECHSRMTGGDGHVIYTRDDRMAKNIEQLQARVMHCSKGSDTGWDDIQIDSVTQYLNEQYYHY